MADGFSLLGLGLAIAAFYVWCVWERLHGRTWKAEGKWESRTQAAQDYMKTLPTMSRRQKLAAWSTVAIGAVSYAVIVFLVRAR